MRVLSYMFCPYLKGNLRGAQCGVVNRSIKDMKDVSIQICMSGHHEACTVYICSLQGPLGKDSCSAASWANLT